MSDAKVVDLAPSSHAQISRTLIYDRRLSIRARMLVVYGAAHGKGWEMRFQDLSKKGLGQPRALRKAFQELCALGFATRITKQKTDGTWDGSAYLVADFPKWQAGAERAKKAMSVRSVLKKPPPPNRSFNHTSYDSSNPKAAARSRGLAGECDGSSFGLDKESKSPSHAKIAAVRYGEFLVKNRLHLGRPGSTKAGWSPQMIQSWTKEAQLLLDQLDGDWPRLKRVLKWYFENFRGEYTPKRYTFKTFCADFIPIEAAMKRTQEINGEPESKGKLVYRETGRGTTIASIER